MFLNNPTPIETYLLGNTKVYVKRDDLFASPPAPPMAKMRGIQHLLSRLSLGGVCLVGAFEASVSSVGHAVAAATSGMNGIRCVIGYIATDKRPVSESARVAKSLGAELFPLRPNVMNVCYGQLKRVVEGRGGHMIPFGFEFPEAIDSVADEAATVPPECSRCGTVVVCCGSGVTLAGIFKGLSGRPTNFIGVSSGRSIAKIAGCLGRQGITRNETIRLITPVMPYREPCRVACPFPSDAFYDRKAWAYLIDNVSQLRSPILFWNVGGREAAS